MNRKIAPIRLLLLTVAGLALGAPALAQEPDPTFERTLRDLNADVDYGEIYRSGEGGAESGRDGEQGPVTERTYKDPGRTRAPVADRDRTPPPAGDGEQELLDTIRDAERITQ
jgi:hypothetical protein